MFESILHKEKSFSTLTKETGSISRYKIPLIMAGLPSNDQWIQVDSVGTEPSASSHLQLLSNQHMLFPNKPRGGQDMDTLLLSEILVTKTFGFVCTHSHNVIRFIAGLITETMLDLSSF